MASAVYKPLVVIGTTVQSLSGEGDRRYKPAFNQFISGLQDLVTIEYATSAQHVLALLSRSPEPPIAFLVFAAYFYRSHATFDALYEYVKRGGLVVWISYSIKVPTLHMGWVDQVFQRFLLDWSRFRGFHQNTKVSVNDSHNTLDIAHLPRECQLNAFVVTGVPATDAVYHISATTVCSQYVWIHGTPIAFATIERGVFGFIGDADFTVDSRSVLRRALAEALARRSGDTGDTTANGGAGGGQATNDDHAGPSGTGNEETSGGRQGTIEPHAGPYVTTGSHEETSGAEHRE